MKIFARIDNQQVGPLGLEELLKAGVRPSTYVWHKGMADWERAEDVPDVCRAMRRALAGLDPVTGDPIALPGVSQKINNKEQEELDNKQAAASGLRGIRGLPDPGVQPNFSIKPQGVSVIIAILTTVFCFPLTGMVAIWFAMKCKAHWKMSEDPKATPKEVEEMQRSAHNDARIYRMMIGITFCLGMIMIGFTMSQMGLN